MTSTVLAAQVQQGKRRVCNRCCAGIAAGRKGTCKARRRTPPPPAAAPPLTGEALRATAA